MYPQNYNSKSYHYIFSGVDYRVWAIAFIAIGVTMVAGTLSNTFIWRLGAAGSGGILCLWSLMFATSGAFTRSPPTFFIWLSAAVLSILIAVVMQPSVIDNFLSEVEKMPKIVCEG